MLRSAKKDDRPRSNYKKARGVNRGTGEEDGEVSRGRARSLRNVQKVGLRVLVDDGMEPARTDKRRKRVFAGVGDRTNRKSVDGKGKTRLGEFSADSSSGNVVRRVRKVQVSGMELKSKAKRGWSENGDTETGDSKGKWDGSKKFTLASKEKGGRTKGLAEELISKAKRGWVENGDTETRDSKGKWDGSKKFTRTLKEKGGRTRGLTEELESRDDGHKTRKRVIRIDPHDISNKRLDDGIVVPGFGDIEVKKDTPEKDAQLSKNAQFRAIQPSDSILSFVEDNLLGRRRMIDLRRAGYNTDFSAPLDNTPFSTSSERERVEENVFRNKLSFYAAAKISSSFPNPDLPEVAFAGRSNVGKSSLLNALTRQWGVARTSDKPGLTQTINFFNLGTKLCLVDLPGYGFAYAKDEDKDSWEELVKEYVCSRIGLKRVCLLVDTKWGLKQRDHELIDLMERYQTKYQIVLTKTDIVFPIDVARRAMQVEESLKGNRSVVQPLMMVSSKSGAGIRCLRTALSRIARFVKI